MGAYNHIKYRPLPSIEMSNQKGHSDMNLCDWQVQSYRSCIAHRCVSVICLKFEHYWCTESFCNGTLLIMKLVCSGVLELMFLLFFTKVKCYLEKLKWLNNSQITRFLCFNWHLCSLRMQREEFVFSKHQYQHETKLLFISCFSLFHPGGAKWFMTQPWKTI